MRVLLGISGGIAAYKTPELIRKLRKLGVEVIPVLTQSATDFVSTLTLQSVANHPVYTSNSSQIAGKILHLELAKSTDLCLIAPATANLIAKLAAGIADDLLTSTILAHKGLKIVVPAMHPEMLENPITQRNLNTLSMNGFKCLGPASGELACGDEGEGRMVDLELIGLYIQLQGLPPLDLREKRILISSGGTQEALDPVRILTNRSTGQLGNMIAQIAALSGAKVTLVTTTNPLTNPHIEKVSRVQTAAEMQAQITLNFPHCDALIMAAAVSDYTPLHFHTSKLSRKESLTLELKSTPDILNSLTSLKNHQKMIGFCLATDNIIETAHQKMKEKSLDWIIANTPDSIGNLHRKMTLINRNGDSRLVDLPLLSAAHRILSTCL